MTTAQALVVDAVRCGVLLMADGDRLRFKALRTLPDGLARRIKANRSEVLDLLQPDAKPERYICTHNPSRQPVVDLILPIHRVDPERAEALRDQWQERIAICTFDGGLSEPEAERVALAELRLEQSKGDKGA